LTSIAMFCACVAVKSERIISALEESCIGCILEMANVSDVGVTQLPSSQVPKVKRPKPRKGIMGPTRAE
jgi:hypothetical protein